jgi:hypothetical protein
MYGCLALGGSLDGYELLRPETIELGRTPIATGDDVLGGEPQSFGVGYALPADPAIEPKSTSSDTDGRFRFERLDPMFSWSLEVDLGDGTSWIRRVDLDLDPGRELDLGDILLRPLTAVHGRLLDHDGAPVVGARVHVVPAFSELAAEGIEDLQPGVHLLYRSPEAEPLMWSPPAWLDPILASQPLVLAEGPSSVTTTDAMGAFRTECDPRGPSILFVEVPGVATAFSREISLDEDSDGDLRDLRVPRVEDLEIRVVDEHKAPIENAEVCVSLGPERLISGEDARKDKEADEEPGEESVEEPDADSWLSRDHNPLRLSLPTRTESGGKAILRTIADAPVWLAIRPPGAATWTVRERGRGKKSPVVAVAAPARSARVLLKDGQPRPLAGEVRLFSEPHGIGPCSGVLAMLPLLMQSSLPVDTVAESPGSYRIRGMSSGKYQVYARAPGFAIASADASIDAHGEPTVAMKLVPARPLRIRVVEKANGAPAALAGAFVTWRASEEGDRWPSALGAAVTGDDGLVLVADAGSTELQVAVEHPRFAKSETRIEPSSEAEITVQMSTGGSIEGQVRRAGEAPGDRLGVFLMRDDSEGSDSRSAVADAEGKFRFDRLAAGKWSIDVGPRSEEVVDADSEGSGRTASTSAEVQDGAVRRVEIDLSTGGKEAKPGEGRIHGTVRREGEPVAGAILYVSADIGSESKFSSRVHAGADGRFFVGPMLAGRYDVDVQMNGSTVGYEDVAERSIVVAAAADCAVDFDLVYGGPIQGSIRSDVSGVGVEDLQLTLWPSRDIGIEDEAGDSAGYALGLHWTDTDKEGAFRFPPLPAGTYLLVADSQELLPGTLEVHLLPGKPLALAPLVLAQGPLVEGEVLFNVDGRVESAELGFSQLSGGDPKTSSIGPRLVDRRIDADPSSRRFQTHGLAPGRYLATLVVRVGAEEEPKDKAKGKHAVHDGARASSTRTVVFESIEVEVSSGGQTGLALKFEREKE